VLRLVDHAQMVASKAACSHHCDTRFR
jgi:hypothetical protein